MRKTFLKAMFGALALSALTLIAVTGANPKDKKEGDFRGLAEDLKGAWVFVGVPGNINEPPATGGRYKFRTGRHWNLNMADPKTGVVTEHDGGTYTLDGDEYIETVEYACPSTINFVGKTYRFTVKVEGDYMTQKGIGNPFTEVWKRVK
jgi:hypothetical protein